jgi:hypothetical protein
MPHRLPYRLLLLLLALALVCPTGARGQTTFAGGAATSYAVNDITTGTTTTLLAKLTTTGALKAATTDTTVPVFLVTGGGGTAGSASLLMSGSGVCTMDATQASARGYYVVASTTTAGQCHPQASQPTTAYCVGRVLDNATTSGQTATITTSCQGLNSTGSGDFSTNTTTSGSGEVVGFADTGGKTGTRSFVAFSGPASSLKTFTLPNASATILTSNAAVTVPQGGTGTGSTLTGLLLGGASAFTAITSSTTGQVPRVTGANTFAFGALDLTNSNAITGILGGANGGTANGFFAVSGPTTALKTFTFPDASATVLTTNTPVTVGQGGTSQTTFTAHGVLVGNGGSGLNVTAAGTSGQCLVSNGASADPTFQSCSTGSGTVTSVATGFGLTGGTITTTGTVSMVAPAGDDQVYVSDSSSTATWRTLPNCTDAGGNHLNYTAATNTWSCGTSSSGGGGGAFSSITTGTNTTATMTVGTGATLTVSGSGVVNATQFKGNAQVAVADGGTGTGSTLTGLVRGGASAFTATELSGDAATSGSNTVTVTGVHGVTYPANPSTNTIPVVTSANTITYELAPVLAGGTGVGTLTTHGVVLGQGTAAVHVTTAGSSGQCLLSNGASADPTFQACPSGSGYATIQNSGTALTQRTTVNFAGTGVVCTDNSGATRTDCTITAGSGTPAGSAGQVEYNNGGSAFGGSSALTMSGTSLNSQQQTIHAPVSASQNLDCTAMVWPVTVGAGGLTLTLPAANTTLCGSFTLFVTDTGAGLLTLAPFAGGDQLNFVAGTKTTTGQGQGFAVTLQNPGTGNNGNWLVESIMTSVPDYRYYPAALCLNSVGQALWSVGATPQATCRAGANGSIGAFLTWSHTDVAQVDIGLPLDWQSSIAPSLTLKLASTDTTGGDTITMQAATACSKDDGSTLDDVTFNPVQSFSPVSLNGTANTAWKTTLANITMTGCTAGSTLHLKISRLSSDTASNVRVYGLGVTLNRTLVTQAN